MFMNKCNKTSDHFLALRDQVNTAIRLRSKTVLDALVNIVVLVVNVSEFDDGDSCLVFVLIEIFKEFTEGVTQEKKSVFVTHSLKVLYA